MNLQNNKIRLSEYSRGKQNNKTENRRHRVFEVSMTTGQD